MQLDIQRLARIIGFLGSHELRCVDAIQQFLEVFFPDIPETQTVSEYTDTQWGRRIKDAVHKKLLSATPTDTIVNDEGLQFGMTPYQCPECGEGTVWAAMFCDKLYKENPDVDTGGLMVCEFHPLISKTLQRDPTKRCFFEQDLPKRKDTCGGCGKRKE